MVATNNNVIVSDVESAIAVFVHDDTASDEVWPVVCGSVRNSSQGSASTRTRGGHNLGQSA